MALSQGYMIVDIGTGNVRVAITTLTGEILRVERDNVHYTKDDLYLDALYFDPERLWDQIVGLSRKALSHTPDVRIKAVTASSQREGIVLVDINGKGLIGLPNHDHRGREWVDTISDKSHIYRLTGRYPSSLFSVFKVIGVRNRRPEIYEGLDKILSISDWAQFKLSGVQGYEHSQASETQLYDVAGKKWSSDLCSIFELPGKLLPSLHHSGTVLGNVIPEIAQQLNIPDDAVVIVGGADTQLAIKSTQPTIDDIVIVSGTTTPVVKIVREYVIDKKERTWTNRHIDKNSFILEANAGVTGLNYQRLKDIFYPNEGYDVIEQELATVPDSLCVASLGSVVADEKKPLMKGGFVFNTPVSHQLNRASFAWSILWEIACCIKENYDCLVDVTKHDSDYVWACGGGLQSKMLRQSISDLTGKSIRVREGFQQASVKGGALICNESVDTTGSAADFEEIRPQQNDHYHDLYLEWKRVRTGFKEIF
jgi:autoinducer 2 (AI-2) kinase